MDPSHPTPLQGGVGHRRQGGAGAPCPKSHWSRPSLLLSNTPPCPFITFASFFLHHLHTAITAFFFVCLPMEKEVVLMRVGGELFAPLKSTLTKSESMLRVLVDGKWDAIQENGEIIIDRPAVRCV